MEKSVHRTRLGIVAGLVAIALVIMYPPSTSLKQGIDLQGGYSVIYELAFDEGDLQADYGRITQDTIVQLRNRVDPTQQRGLVWRQIGANRIEIQMPLAGTKTVEAREKYQAAQQAIEQTNISISAVVRVLEQERDPAQRAAQLQALAGSDAQRRALVGKIATAYDRYRAARTAAEAALATRPADSQPASGPLEAGVEAGELALAAAELDDLYGQLRDTNVNLAELGRVLDMNTAQKAGKAAREEALARLQAKHPAVTAQITAAVTAFDEWRQVKGPLDDLEDLKRILKGAGALDFRILPRASDVPDLQRLVTKLNERGPKPFKEEPFCWIEIDKPDDFKGDFVRHVYAGKEYVLAYNNSNETTLLHNAEQRGGQPWRLVRAYPMPNERSGGYAVSFELDGKGGGQFLAMTGRNVNRPLCIVLDNKAISAPNLESAIGSHGQITGNFSEKEIRYLVDTLNAGRLKAQLKDTPIAERSVGSSLGETNRTQGIRSVILGFVVTLIFMAAYYYWAGAIANFALVINLVLILAVMVLLNASFTLPGLAGLVLTLAMAVDANVLINERIREEQARGLTLRHAIKEGYGRAFLTILDSNLTTVLTAVIMYYFGSEDIKGFAITLFWGLVISMFTALWVTRAIFDWAVDTGKLTTVRMRKWIGTGTVDWIALQPLFRTISGVVILASIGVFIYATISPTARARIFDIEFLGGTSVQVDFAEGQKISDTQVRDDIEKAAIKLGGTWAQAVQGATIRPVPGAPLAVQVVAPSPDQVRWASEMIAALLPQAVTAVDVSAGMLQVNTEPAQRDAQAAGLAYDNPVQYLQARLPGLVADMKQAASELRDASVQRIGDDGRSYEVITTVRLRDLVVQTILNEFGPRLEQRPPLKFAVKNDPAKAREGNFFPVEAKLLNAVIGEGPAEPVSNFLGGAALVLQGLEPAQPLDALRQRLRTARLSPEFEQSAWREFDVVGVQATGLKDAKGQPLYSSVAILVRDPNVDAVADERDWLSMCQEELKLAQVALGGSNPLSKVTLFDAQVASTAKQQGIVSVLLAFFGVAIYVWLRFGSINFGIGALASVFHDLIVAVGVVCLLNLLPFNIAGMKINLVVVGAFLTVIGYSINDTIVVFDRIRETRGRSLAALTPRLINDAINQTLSRTLLTSVTVIMVLTVMIVFGGLGLRGFSVAMLVGVLTGTYSSIAIAAPLLLVRWGKGEKAKGPAATAATARA